MKRNWKQLLDELEVQLALGQAEGRDAYEEQKRKLKVAVHDAREKVLEFKILSASVAEELKAKLGALEVQLALGKAEGKVAYAEQKAEVENALTDLRATLNRATEESDVQFDEWRAQLESRLNIYRMKLDIFRLHFALGKAEAENEFNELRSELKSKLRIVKAKTEDLKGEAEEFWDDFSNDLSMSIENVGHRLDKLFS